MSLGNVGRLYKKKNKERKMLSGSWTRKGYHEAL